jgi:hypothetical protein
MTWAGSLQPNNIVFFLPFSVGQALVVTICRDFTDYQHLSRSKYIYYIIPISVDKIDKYPHISPSFTYLASFKSYFLLLVMVCKGGKHKAPMFYIFLGKS